MSAMRAPAVASMQSSRSQKCHPKRCPSSFPTVLLPQPMKPSSTSGGAAAPTRTAMAECSTSSGTATFFGSGGSRGSGLGLLQLLDSCRRLPYQLRLRARSRRPRRRRTAVSVVDDAFAQQRLADLRPLVRPGVVEQRQAAHLFGNGFEIFQHHRARVAVAEVFEARNGQQLAVRYFGQHALKARAIQQWKFRQPAGQAGSFRRSEHGGCAANLAARLLGITVGQGIRCHFAPSIRGGQRAPLDVWLGGGGTGGLPFHGSLAFHPISSNAELGDTSASALPFRALEFSLAARRGVPGGWGCRSRSRIFILALCSCDFEFPIEHPIMVAISLCSYPSMSCSTKMVRYPGGRCSIARSKFTRSIEPAKFWSRAPISRLGPS